MLKNVGRRKCKKKFTKRLTYKKILTYRSAIESGM